LPVQADEAGHIHLIVSLPGVVAFNSTTKAELPAR